MAQLPNPFPGQPTTSTQKTNNVSGTKAGFNGTLIAVVLDESGSMMSCYDQTITGFNEFVDGQRAASGNAYLKVNKFEGGNVVDLWGVKDVNTTPPMSSELYRPMGGTNLYDAIGKTINEVDAHLASMKEKDRPSVMILIMTDGAENQSREYTNKAIKKMVKDREACDWAFSFIGANIDAMAVGSTFGMSSANTMQYDTSNTAATFSSLSSSATRYRNAKSAGASTHALYSAGLYTDEERKNSGGS
jgi:uncharacterized protein YegL